MDWYTNNIWQCFEEDEKGEKQEPDQAIKEWIAGNYGENNCITDGTEDDLTLACMTDNLAIGFLHN